MPLNNVKNSTEGLYRKIQYKRVYVTVLNCFMSQENQKLKWWFSCCVNLSEIKPPLYIFKLYVGLLCRMIIKEADFDVNTSKVQSEGITIAVLKDLVSTACLSSQRPKRHCHRWPLTFPADARIPILSYSRHHLCYYWILRCHQEIPVWASFVLLEKKVPGRYWKGIELDVENYVLQIQPEYKF